MPAPRTTAVSPGTGLAGDNDMGQRDEFAPGPSDVAAQITALMDMDMHALKIEWRRHYRGNPPARLSRRLMRRAIAYRVQERIHGGLSGNMKRKLRLLAQKLDETGSSAFDPGIILKPGAKLVREWGGETHTVVVLENGFEYDGQCHQSLSKIAKAITGAHWSGPRFFGLARAQKPFSTLGGADHGQNSKS